jgi:hypothetical protein
MVNTGITLASYIVYLGITIAMTIWVARTISQHAVPFLEDAFSGDTRLAHSVNQLLVVGFYLINLGYILNTLTLRLHPVTTVQAVEFLSVKIGGVLLILGCMHFFNIFVLSRYRRNRLLQNAPAPLKADAVRTVTPGVSC